MECLDAMYEHGSILLAQDILANFDRKVRTYADEVAVERCVMKAAQRKPVLDERVSSGLGVRNNVGGIEEFLMPETAERALALVCVEYALSEHPLMQPDADGSGYVRSTSLICVLGFCCGLCAESNVHSVVYSDREREASGIIANDEHRPAGEVLPGDHAVEVDERQTTLHREPEAAVVDVRGVRASIPISQQSVRSE